MLTDDQQKRLEELKSQKAYLKTLRSEYLYRKSKISDILDNVDEYWANNTINNDSDNNDGDMLIREIDLRNSINNTQGDNWANKLNNNVDEMSRWLNNEYGTVDSAVYSRWVKAANEKINIDDRRISMMEILAELNSYLMDGNSGALIG